MPTPRKIYCREYENSVKRSVAHITRTRCSGESRWRPLCRSGAAKSSDYPHYTTEKWQRTVVPTTADERRESMTGYKPLCISTPGDSHCSNEISGLRVLNTLQHGIDDDDDEMQLAAQTVQHLESR